VNGEYQPLLLAGEQYDPVKAAKQAASGIGIHDWIPGPVQPGVPAPLSQEDVASLYASHQAIPASLEHDLAQGLPLPESVPSVNEFAAAIAEIGQHQGDGNYNHRRDLWFGVEAAPGSLESVINNVVNVMVMIRQDRLAPWRLAIGDCGRGLSRAGWRSECMGIAMSGY
jgi:hypothetical protein